MHWSLHVDVLRGSPDVHQEAHIVIDVILFMVYFLSSLQLDDRIYSACAIVNKH